MTTRIRPLIEIIDAPTPTKVLFRRNGKVYTAWHENGVVFEITSAGNGSGRFRRYTPERCPVLYDDIEAVLADALA